MNKHIQGNDMANSSPDDTTKAVKSVQVPPLNEGAEINNAIQRQVIRHKVNDAFEYGQEATSKSSVDTVNAALNLIVTEIEQLIATAERAARIDELNNLTTNLVDGQTVNPIAPDHDNYILKVYVVAQRLTELSGERV